MLLLVCLFMLKEVFDKKNEMLEVEFFENEECTKVFDFKDAKNLYIELHNGDVTHLMFLYGKIQNCTLYIPYLPNVQQVEVYSLLNSVLHARGIKLHTLSQIGAVSNRIACIDNTAIFTKINNLSKYIPEDNAVLFLSKETNDDYKNVFFKCGSICTSFAKISVLDQIKWLKDGGLFHNKITIFLLHGTQSELQEANEVAKELKEKYGVEEVNLFVLHWFTDVNDRPNPDSLGIYDKRSQYRMQSKQRCDKLRQIKIYANLEAESIWKKIDEEDEVEFKKMGYINKIITTN
jgi:hypothetical protein